MDLSDYTQSQPCVSILQSDGARIRSVSEPVTDDGGQELYRTGTMQIVAEVDSAINDLEYYNMSSFSSWGVPYRSKTAFISTATIIPIFFMSVAPPSPSGEMIPGRRNRALPHGVSFLSPPLEYTKLPTHLQPQEIGAAVPCLPPGQGRSAMGSQSPAGGKRLYASSWHGVAVTAEEWGSLARDMQFRSEGSMLRFCRSCLPVCKK